MARIIMILAMLWCAGGAVAQSHVARIGVLAFRGVETTTSEWQPLADYLSRQIDGWHFELVPVTLETTPEALASGQLDFLVTNPGHYVSLAPDFGLSPLATREKSGGLMQFGVAIIARSGAGISTLEDLRGKTVAAVSPEAFGGFQLGWHAFMQEGIDPFSDLRALRFMGFPHDEIIKAVREGRVDAGIIRGGLLEKLAAGGQLSMQDFVVLRSNGHPGFPYLVSGELMPEWPFLVMPDVEKHLRESVLVALLETQKGTSGLQDIWSAPLSYERVRQLNATYQNRAKSGSVWPYWLGAAMGVLLLSMWGWRAAFAPVSHDPPAPLPDSDPGPDDTATIALFESLTKRERQVLALVCTGKSSKEIAGKLGVSLKTIEYHRANILHKTKAGSSPHLVQLATRLGYDLG